MERDASKPGYSRCHTEVGSLAMHGYTMHGTALSTSGKRTLKTHVWLEAKSTEMTPVIGATFIAPAENKTSPYEKNLGILTATRSKYQQTGRYCTSEYWTKYSESIQTNTVTGNRRGM